MPVHWWIECEVFPDTAKRITDALDRRGWDWTHWEDGVNPSFDSPVVFWGSLGVAFRSRGSVGSIRPFFCSTYYQYLGEYLANTVSVFTTVSELVAESSIASDSRRIFVRPDSPMKPFSGRVLARDEIDLAALDHGFYYEDENLPILVSSAKTIGSEWRFVIVKGRVATGCEYGVNEALDMPELRSRVWEVDTEIPTQVMDLAKQVAAMNWQAAQLYILDIGNVNGQIRVLELNPFSGADFYGCDPDAVIDAVQLFYGSI